MKTCKVHPDTNNCRRCIYGQLEHNVIFDCEKCPSIKDRYVLLQIGTSFWSGNYAFVQKDGEIDKVPLHRVYDIKEDDSYE